MQTASMRVNPSIVLIARVFMTWLDLPYEQFSYNIEDLQGSFECCCMCGGLEGCSYDATSTNKAFIRAFASMISSTYQ
jgi:hypothetical protein